MLYDDIEPFGSPRDDERAGIVASVVANVNRDPKRRAAPFMPADFFAHEFVPPVPLTPDQFVAVLRDAAPGPRKVRREPRS